MPESAQEENNVLTFNTNTHATTAADSKFILNCDQMSADIIKCK